MPWRRSQSPRSGAAVLDGEDAADMREAYERGRRDERARRRHHPVLMTLTFLVAAVGAVVLVMAASEGSFARGGALVDHGLSITADRAAPMVRNAGADAGQAVRDAGQAVKSDADKAQR